MGISELKRAQVRRAQGRKVPATWADGDCVGQDPPDPPDPIASHDPKSRIRIVPGQSGGLHQDMKSTVVQLPFTEATPTMTSSAGQAMQECATILEDLGTHECDVVLSNLLAKFAEPA